MKFFLANRTSGRIIAYPAVVFLSIASFTAAALGADANGRDQSRSAFEGDCNCKVRSDLKYKNAASYAALDIYYREDGTGKPVLLFIHGGGWVTGDKSNITRNPDMLRSFLDAGYVVACPNFRLVERSLQSQVRYHHMAEDIAAAIKWLNGNVHRYGGDPAAFVLAGYSSGAHLASLVATDERYLEQQGLDTKIIRAVSAWDVPAYDVPRALTLMKGTSLEPKIRFNQALFGRSRSEQLEASPLNYLDREGSHVQFQLISAGTMRGQSQTISQRVSESFRSHPSWS